MRRVPPSLSSTVLLPTRFSPLLLAPVLLALASCASFGGREAASETAPAEIPPDAVATTRAGPNGDQVVEYRVAGQLRVVKVIPLRGPPYYLYDRNGDGRIDRDKTVSPVYFKIFEW